MTLHPKSRPNPPRASERGFTLLELIIVVAIIGILATMAMPALKDVPRRAQEAVLKTNLKTIREVIDQYYGDTGHYPPGLDDLVKAGYLRQIPWDPITKSSQTWVPILEDDTDGGDTSALPTDENGEPVPGMIDVHSGSPLLALDGSPYADW